ncbi:adenylate/guanylate cyclase domain-containing protein [Sorangium sp. So ce693]|uniref:adenylate/guanylate cyclase domain-containing protein n=1 Tax=Sorangium sp. So ce693 TaxID=3133318 RepID=UPI003F62D3F3
MVTLEQIAAIVLQNAVIAYKEAMRIELSSRLREKVAKSMITDISAFSSSKLSVGCAVKVPAATILFVDMRGSTRRANELGAEKTYITMHALLPALAHIVAEHGGYVVGFRGDGLFAVFGIDEHGNSSAGAGAVATACMAGCFMVEAVKYAVNPILGFFGIPGDVSVGVGVDAGEIVITRIGLENMYEITAYGDAVNRAAKLCSKGGGEVIVSTSAEQKIPRVKGGRLRIGTHVVFDADLSGQLVTTDQRLLEPKSNLLG